MIHNFEYLWSTKLIIGDHGIDKIGPMIKADGATKVMLHYGGGDYLWSTGLMDRIIRSLDSVGLQWIQLGGVKPNPRLSLVYEGIELVREHDIDYIISIGGGSACDSSKAIAMGAVYKGDVWDLFDMSGKLAPDAKIIPVAAVVTYPATGSEAGVTAVVNNEKIIRKTWAGHEKARPHFAFMDPQYTVTLPQHLLINGMCDIMAHHTDRYMTDDAHFGVFDSLLESAMHYLRTELIPTILDPDKDNLVDRTELMAIADMGVDEFIAWGRNKENASHQLGHSIGAMYDTIHGSTLSIIYCSWLPYVYKDNVLRVARWAEKVWDVKSDPAHPEKVAEEGMARMKQWFISLGMPTCFADLGIHPTEDELQHMTDMTTIAMGSDHIGVMKKLYREDILQIYKNAL